MFQAFRILLLSTVVLSSELVQEIFQELSEAALHGQRATQLMTKLQDEASHQPHPPAPLKEDK